MVEGVLLDAALCWSERGTDVGGGSRRVTDIAGGHIVVVEDDIFGIIWATDSVSVVVSLVACLSAHASLLLLELVI